MPYGTEKPAALIQHENNHLPVMFLEALPLRYTTMAWSLSSLPYSLQKNIKPLI